MKRWKCLGSLLFCFFILVSAINAGGNQAQSQSGVTEINFLLYSGDSEMDGWNGMVESFNKLNSDVHVTISRVPGDWYSYTQKITTLIAAGTPPDIGRMGVAFMPQFASRGQLLDLTDRVKNELNMADYYQSAFDSVKINGKLYGLPCGLYTLVLFYNKQIFDDAGIPYPSSDWDNAITMSDFESLAHKLTKGSGVDKVYGFWANLHPERSVQFFFSNGGNVLSDDMKTATMDQPPMIETYKMLQRFYNDGVSPMPATLQTMPFDQMFSAGKIAMFIEGQWNIPWMTSYKNLRFGVAATPKGSKSTTTVNFLDQHVVFAGSKHPNEAWRVIKSFISKDGEEILVKTNNLGTPIYKPVLNAMRDQIYTGLSESDKDCIFKSIDYSKAMPFTSNWGELMNIVTKTTDLIPLNQISAEDAMKKVNAEIQAQLK